MNPHRLFIPLLATASLGAAGSVARAAVVAETHRLEEAPYYVKLARPQPAPGSCAVVLPVEVDPELEQQFGNEELAEAMTRIVDALNARIASMAAACLSPATAWKPAGRAPRVYVGSAESDYAPPEGAQQRLGSDRFDPMILHLTLPDADWRRATAATVAAGDSPFAIHVNIGISQYMKGYSSPFKKEVALGTGHRQSIRFMTAEDKPVEVLHLTGVLVDVSGKPIRAGAEGIILRDTPFAAQAIDVRRGFDPDELGRVLTRERRNDLPGAPLNYEVALDNLLAQLTRGTLRVPAN